jgi:hypothetical protein
MRKGDRKMIQIMKIRITLAIPSENPKPVRKVSNLLFMVKV